jgi:DNA-binding LacI/PurR family transcriptional regulator
VVNTPSSVDVVPGNKVPLYLQVAQVIRKRVRTGTYRPECPLPSIRQLGKELGVTASIVHRAVRALERQGVVTTQHGKEMVLATEDPCRQAAILFGFIHPYTPEEEFNRSVLGFVNEAFEDRANLVVTRTSKNDPAREREAAEHLIANGVKGLLIWGTEDDENGRHFTDLSKNIPIVLVDRFMRGADLPAVVLDHYRAGQEICLHLLETLNKKRLLVAMDDLHISAYEEMILGFKNTAADLNRAADLTVVQYPMQEILGPVRHRDYSVIQVYRERVERLLREDNYDAVFSNHGLFIDRVIVETGLADDFPGLRMATLCNQGVHTGSRRFSQIAPLQWDISFPEMIARAADILQEMILNRRNKKKVIRLPMRRLRNSRKGNE